MALTMLNIDSLLSKKEKQDPGKAKQILEIKKRLESSLSQLEKIAKQTDHFESTEMDFDKLNTTLREESLFERGG